MESSVVSFIGEKRRLGFLKLCLQRGELTLKKAVFLCQLYRLRCIGRDPLGKELFDFVTPFLHLISQFCQRKS